jgi:hypothetical protein
MRIAIALMVWARFADRFVLSPGMDAMQAGLALCFYVSSLMMLVGKWSRGSAAVCATVLLYGYHYRGPYLGIAGWGSNNIKLLALTVAILALTPCGRAYSLDRWKALRLATRGSVAPPDESIPLWSTRLLAALLCSVYASTFIAKTTIPYLSGSRLEAIFALHYTGSDYLDGTLWAATMQIGAVGVWLLEGLLVFGLLVGPLRKPLMLAGAAMHLSFYALFRVFAFSTNVIMLYWAFVPTSTVARAIDDQCGYRDEPATAGTPPALSLTGMWGRVVVLGAIAVVTLALGIGQLLETPGDARSDLRVPQLMLMRPRLEPLANPEWDRETTLRHKRREKQRWRSPK